MNILLREPCYRWLVQMKVLKPYIIRERQQSEKQTELIQVCYDDQLYLQNAYLIGLLLKEILKGHELYSEKLLKIRKITVLKKYQNWEIIYEVLAFLQYEQYQPQQQKQLEFQNQNSDREVLIRQIQQILHFLYDKYGPQSHKLKQQTKRHLHIEIQKLQRTYENDETKSRLDGVQRYGYTDCKNMLEYTIMVLKRSFGSSISVSECLGLISDRGRFLKSVIIKGISSPVQENSRDKMRFNQYEHVQQFYHELLNSTTQLQSLVKYEPQHLSHFLSIFGTGALSISLQVAQLTIKYLQQIDCSEWFQSEGIPILVKSQHPQILSFLLQKCRHNYQKLFGLQRLSMFFSYDQDLILFLTKMLPIIAQSRYCKQIMQYLTLDSLIEKTLQPFSSEYQDSIQEPISQPQTRQISRQLLTTIYKHFFKSLTEEQRSLGIIAFQNQSQFSESIIAPKRKLTFLQSLQMLVLLFQIIKVSLVNEDVIVQKWFRIVLRFMKVESDEIRQFIVLNLKELYFILGNGFPLGALLSTYHEVVFTILNDFNKSQKSSLCSKVKIHKKYEQTINSNNTSQSLKLNGCKQSRLIHASAALIPQYIDYQLLERVSLDSSLVEDEVLNALNIAFQMFLQINGSVFITILSNLIKFNQASQWVAIISNQILSQWTQLKLPSPQLSQVYNRKSPLQKSKFQAFGIKRREILKFQQYKKYKTLLQLFCSLKNKQFLGQYFQHVNKLIAQINRDPSLKAYNVFLRKLAEKIRLSKEMMRSQPLEELLTKSLGYSRQVDRSVKIEDRNSINQDRILQSSFLGQQRQSMVMSQMIDEDENQQSVNQDQLQKEQAFGDNEFLEQGGEDTIEQNKTELSKSDAQKQVKDQEYENLLQFTEQESISILNQENGDILTEEQMEQHQIVFLSVMKNNHQQIIDYCTTVFFTSNNNQEHQQLNTLKSTNQKSQKLNQLDKQKQLYMQKYLENLIKKFLKQIKIEKYIPLKQALTLWKSIQIIHPNQNQQQYIWLFLTQLAFSIFGFRRNTRVRIKLIQTFLTILKTNLKHELNSFISNSKIRTNSEMKRKIQYHNQLTIAKILKWNPHWENIYFQNEKITKKEKQKQYQMINSPTKEQMAGKLLDRYNGNQPYLRPNKKNEQSQYNQKEGRKRSEDKYEMKRVVRNQLQGWLVSFQVLNDILLQMKYENRSKSVGISLIQPLSKLVTTVSQNQPQEQQQGNQNTEDQQQLQLLEQHLKQQTQLKSSHLVEQNNSPLIKKTVASSILKSLPISKKKKQQLSTSEKKKQKIPNQNLTFTSQQLPPQFAKLSSNQLKNKLNSRKQLIQKQLKNLKLNNDKYSQPQNQQNQQELNQKISFNQINQIDPKTKKQLQKIISYNADRY